MRKLSPHMHTEEKPWEDTERRWLSTARKKFQYKPTLMAPPEPQKK
jgi:hypothetical protein